MNKIEIGTHRIPSGYETRVIFIDGIPLYEYIDQWVAGDPELSAAVSPTDMLEICWTDVYDFNGDAKFMRYVLSQQNAITPVLSCPDDFDFSCIVIVADVEKTDEKVIWKRIGLIDHSGELYEEEKRCGIAHTQSYSKEDIILYGDNIALAQVDSPQWQEWVSAHWDEELYRRRINYTFPYYQNENNTTWFCFCNFEFDRKEYDLLVDGCFKT